MFVEREIVSGWRAASKSNRIHAAAEVSDKVLKNFTGHKVQKFAFGTKELTVGGYARYKAFPEDSNHGGFEIHSRTGHIASVYFPKHGKPSIAVVDGNEKLGNALARAFKEDAGYRFLPKVTTQQKLKTMKEHFRWE